MTIPTEEIIMQTKFDNTAQPLRQEPPVKKSRRLAGLIGFGLCCGLLVGPPGCRSPGRLPRLPKLTLAGVAEMKPHNLLMAQVPAAAGKPAHEGDSLPCQRDNPPAQ